MRRMRIVVVCASIVASCLGPGCSRPNPSFDLSGESTGADATPTTGRPGVMTSDPASDGTTGSRMEGSSGSGGVDSGAHETSGIGTTEEPPPHSCAHAPNDGLVLGFGDPGYFGNSCPNSVSVWAIRSVDQAGRPVFVSCMDGCSSCDTEHPYFFGPVPFESYLPADASACLRVQTDVPLADDGELCYWGALTVIDPVAGAPYFIATTASAAPTEAAQAFLGQAIPEPELAKTCECDTLMDPAACCETAQTAAEFWGYPIEGRLVLPGGSGIIAAANGDEVLFEPYQAQSIPACDGAPLQLSWAVVPVE